MLRLLEDILAEEMLSGRLTDRFKDRPIDEGYNPAYGARPLRREIVRSIEL